MTHIIIIICIVSLFFSVILNYQKGVSSIIGNLFLYSLTLVVFWFSGKSTFQSFRTLISGKTYDAEIIEQKKTERIENYKNEANKTSNYYKTDSFNNVYNFVDTEGTNHKIESSISTGDKDSSKKIRLVFSKKFNSVYELRFSEYFFTLLILITFIMCGYIFYLKILKKVITLT